MKTCATDGCEKPSRRRSGYCDMHHRRWVKWGDPLFAMKLGDQARKYERGATCVVDGCDALYTRPGQLCNRHYLRIRRYGSPDEVKVPHRADEPTYVDRRGYIVERWHTGHVIAMNNGHIRRARRVLFDSIGFGPHRCHWCAKHINWSRRSIHRLEADHLDWDRSNDDPANLVPSCTSCNTRRKRGLEI